MIRDLTNRVERLEKQLEDLKKKIRALEDGLNNLENRPSQTVVSSSGPTVMPKEFDDLKERVRLLQKDSKSTLKRLGDHDGILERHTNEIEELKKMVEHINIQLVGLKGNGNGINEQLLKEKLAALRNQLLSRLKAMKREIEKFVKLQKLNEELTLLLQKLAD